VQVQVAQLQAQLLQTREDALRGNDLAQAAFLAHWPLLHALGQPIATLQVTWPLGQADLLAAGARRGYELTLWQLLAPVIWSVQSELNGDSGFGGYPAQYVYGWTPDSSIYSSCDPETHTAWLAQGNAIPNQAGLSRLFDQPAPGDLAGPLGASMYDVVNGYGGWTLPDSLNNACGPQAPPIDPVGLRRPHPNPLPVPS
jgi:hypothetical protein